MATSLEREAPQVEVATPKPAVHVRGLRKSYGVSRYASY